MLSVFVGLDFLLGLELGKVIKGFSSDHGLVSVELELIFISDSVSNLLNLVDTEFLDLVTVEEE